MMFLKLLLMAFLSLSFIQCASSGEEEFVEDNFNAFETDGNFAINNTEFAGNDFDNGSDFNSDGTNEFENFGNFSDEFSNEGANGGEMFNNSEFNEFNNLSEDNWGFSNNDFNLDNDTFANNGNQFAMNDNDLGFNNFNNFNNGGSLEIDNGFGGGMENPLAGEVDAFGDNSFSDNTFANNNFTNNSFSNAAPTFSENMNAAPMDPVVSDPFADASLGEEVLSNVVEDSPSVDTGFASSATGGQVSYVVEAASILDQPAGQVVGQLVRGDHPLIASYADGYAQMSSGYFVESNKLTDQAVGRVRGLGAWYSQQ